MKNKYWLRVDDENRGPYTLNELENLRLKPDDYIWAPGYKDWMKYGAVFGPSYVVKSSINRTGPIVIIGTIIIFIIVIFIQNLPVKSNKEIPRSEDYTNIDSAIVPESNSRRAAEKASLSENYKNKSSQITTGVKKQNDFPSSYNSANDDIEETVRNLKRESDRMHERQMREFEEMKVGLNDFNTPANKEYKDNQRLREIQAETERIRRGLEETNFKPYESPYVPDPVVMPN